MSKIGLQSQSGTTQGNVTDKQHNQGGIMGTQDWQKAFTERELKEILFSQRYVWDFGHGTDGHNAKIISAKMAGLLNANSITELPPFTVMGQK